MFQPSPRFLWQYKYSVKERFINNMYTISLCGLYINILCVVRGGGMGENGVGITFKFAIILQCWLQFYSFICMHGKADFTSKVHGWHVQTMCMCLRSFLRSKQNQIISIQNINNGKGNWQKRKIFSVDLNWRKL